MIEKRLKKRKDYNRVLIDKFKRIQLKLIYKKKKSQFVIKNDFSQKNVKKEIKNILKKLN